MNRTPRLAGLALALSPLALAACAGSSPPPATPTVETTNATVAPATPASSTPESESLSNSSVAAISTPPPNATAGTLTSTTGPTGATAPPHDISDAQIAAILDASIDGQLAEARFVVRKSKDSRAHSLADRVIADQGRAGADLTSFEARHPTVAEGSPTTAELKADDTRTLSALRGVHGLALDAAYVDAVVSRTTRLLALLDGTLIPSADDPELKSELTSVRAMVSAEAALAREAQAAYHGTGPTTAPTLPAPAPTP